MRALALATFLTISISSAHAQSVEEKVAVGPWEIATTFRGSTFINCEMRRTSDGLGITFLRAEDGLTLLLDSAKWKLERGKTYNVKLSAGVGSIDGKAQAESKGVAIALSDRPFTARLRSADTLDVRGDGATLRVPLDGSIAAMDRLETCFAKNSKTSTDANPFVAPNRKP